MKNLFTVLLTWSAKRVLRMHQPKIVAVTGSVGKTSTKDAITAVLQSRYAVRSSSKNLNTEIGVPLSILGCENPERDPWRWTQVLAKALTMGLLKDPNFPTHLVLEFGADRPGDIEHLMETVKPHVGVVTTITHVHVENYPSYEALVCEKAKIVEKLPSDGLAVLNADDDVVLAMREKTEAKVVTYGFGPDAEIDGQNYALETREDASFESGEALAYATFTAHDRRSDETADVRLHDTIGIHQAYDAIAAMAVGQHFGIHLPDAASALSKNYRSPAGRLKPLPGIKGSLLLDDTYNAAPSSTKAALEVLRLFHPAGGSRRIAALGAMGELGVYSEEQHREVGWKTAEVGVDLLLCVGEKARDIARGALEAGMKQEQISELKDPKEAGRFLDAAVRPGDIILIKGSQSARMEVVTKDLLFDPSRAEELLVRQSKKWLK